jgi:serine/threonine-protein kinase
MLKPGTRIGNYEIEARLGHGGMAAVYRAREVYVDTHWAIKVLDPKYREMPEARARFLDEARIQAKHLDHPNIAKVFTIIATEEHAALVMELVDGPSLESRIGELRERPVEIRAIMFGILDGVGHAHAAGIIHRDLKPDNVLLQTRGGALVPKIIDFGIAKLAPASGGSGKRATAGDARMGTLNYMSPEQIKRAGDVTPRSDVFSLGAVLYEMATGAMAFPGDNDYEVMDAIIRGHHRRPAQVYPAVERGLEAIIERALQPDPARRFASCAEMAAALRATERAAAPVTESTPDLRPAPAPPPSLESAASPTRKPAAAGQPRRPTPPRAWYVGGGLVLLASLGVGGAWLLRGGRHLAHGRPVADARPGGCPADMVQVPGGTFLMGSPDGVGYSDERPQRRITLSPYCLDRTEVTAEDYDACKSCEAAERGGDCTSQRAGYERHPINCVRWKDAAAYCASKHKRLPTEPEWELAARGLEGRTYPWGETPPSAKLLNWGGEDPFARTAPVGSFALSESPSPYGAQDLAGNVWEWVADEYGDYRLGSFTDPPAVKTSKPERDKRYSLRGGGWNNDAPSNVRAANRISGGSAVRNSNVGFRCARGVL